MSVSWNYRRLAIALSAATFLGLAAAAPAAAQGYPTRPVHLYVPYPAGGPNDVIALDATLPDADGFVTCRRLRHDGDWTPIIMLTTRAAIEDRIRGLNAGADDYLAKPFAFGELLARLRSLAGRDPAKRPAVIKVGPLRLNPATAQVWRGNQEIRLSAREFALLEAFMRNPGQVLGHNQLLDAAWDIGHDYRSNVIEVYIRYLREKIDRPFNVRSLETVRGLGYRLRPDGGG